MTDHRQALTAANIKYLIVLGKLGGGGEGIRCVEIAGELGVSKPSVHMMMKTLGDLDLIRKDHYGEVYLTDAGRPLACEYAGYFDTICSFFEAVFPSAADVKSAAYALLAEIPAETLASVCEKISEGNYPAAT